ncbi:MAG: AAA family ATPase [Dysgonamonadaceae bacterium]|nr:AAA family ATPase [Dysgonamonadaceae bacterium]
MDPTTRFEAPIRRVCEQTGRKVVVGVDEYDKPLLGTLNEMNSTTKKRWPKCKIPPKKP